MAIFVLTLHVRKTGQCHRGAWKAGWRKNLCWQAGGAPKAGKGQRAGGAGGAPKAGGLVLPDFEVLLEGPHFVTVTGGGGEVELGSSFVHRGTVILHEFLHLGAGH